MEVRLAVAGNQLGPAIAVQIVGRDMTQRPFRDQHVRRAGRREPDAKNRWPALVQPDTVILTVSVEVGDERRARGGCLRKQKKTRTQTPDDREQPNQRTAHGPVSVAEGGAVAHFHTVPTARSGFLAHRALSCK